MHDGQHIPQHSFTHPCTHSPTPLPHPCTHLAPLLPADVWVDAVAPALRALLPALARDVLGHLAPLVAHAALSSTRGWERRRSVDPSVGRDFRTRNSAAAELGPGASKQVKAGMQLKPWPAQHAAHLPQRQQLIFCLAPHAGLRQR